MNKWMKMAFLAILLIGASYLFGVVCKAIGRSYGFMFYPSWDILILLLWFLLALGAVAVTAGLVAALLRPVWTAFVAFVISGMAILLAWQVAVISGVLVVVYLLVTFFYTIDVTKELNQRIKFSVRPIAQGQGMLRMSLVLLACGSLYLGYSANIEKEGFSIPEPYVELIMEQMEERVIEQLPEEQREEAVSQFRGEFRRTIDESMEQMIEPFVEFIPLALAVGMFTTLATITSLLAWLVSLVLDGVFPVLTKVGLAEVVTQTQEVERLVIAGADRPDRSRQVDGTPGDD
jgi:hypothetical protein